MNRDSDRHRCHGLCSRPGLILWSLLIALCAPLTASAQTSPHGKLAFACEECHSPASWTEMTFPSKFKHEKTGFALKGQHTLVHCEKCHTTPQFAVSGKRCADCHDDIHRGELGVACERCHSSDSWLVPDMIQRHTRTGFSLVGAHAFADCRQCHPNQQKHQFVGIRTDCFGCHQQDFENSKSPNHRTAGFTTDCVSCHNITDMHWGGTFDHNRTSFPLLGAHVATPCAGCHTGNAFRGTATQCVSCHRSQFTAATAPAHTGFSTDCTSCHTMNGWQPASFDHSKTSFPLTGGHQAVVCAQCHKNGVFAGTPSTCISCHQTEFQSAANPKHSPGISTDCKTCHSTAAWQPSTFNHSATVFPLTGAHPAVTCAQCHANGVFAGTPTLCYSCHQTDYQNTANPKHAPGFSTDCTGCHTTAAWNPALFDHSKSSFPLTGAHQAVACAQCHKNNDFVGVPTACYGCHLTDFQNAANPKHSPGMPTDCSTCHTTTVWQPSTFDHGKTIFPLTGAHPAVTCAQCHLNGVYVGTSTVCYSCHQTDFQNTTNPKHAPGISTDCASCHLTTAWQPASFDHSKSIFPLTGAHQAVACALCHKNNVFPGTPTACYGCHQTDYLNAALPKHSPGMPTDCTPCHTTAVWQPSTFNHSTTVFPLTGAHQALTCVQCHTTNVYTGGTPTLCYGCHQTDYLNAAVPKHSPTFPTVCTTCHTTTVWQPATFNHATTVFPLTGAHLAVPCAQCHTNGYAGGTPTLCYGCHQTDYVNAAAPKHSPTFPTDCTTCHTTAVWQPATFNHATTIFPLTGAHQAVPCAQCHTNGYAGGTPTLCYSCHQTDYMNAAAPKHNPGIPTTCASCHSTTVWQPSTFNHATTVFPLTGAHQAVPCAQCHTNGFAGGTPTLCYSCHQTNYMNAASPVHNPGMPTDCSTCHTTTVWQPSTFSHTKTVFPLTGAHQAIPCAQCHTNGYKGGTPTLCYTCHQTDYLNAASPKHSPGFPTDCTGCHTTAAWQPASFDHSKTVFPLTGAHLTTPCASCHVNNIYAGTPTTCGSAGCHLPRYNATTNPAHAAAGFGLDCQTCHTTTAWVPSTFNHTTYFPISAGSSHAPGRWTLCTDCHTVSTNYALFSCIDCHAHQPQATVDAQHRGRSGYSYTSAACYRCHPRGTGG